jgi:hypothetical protein
MVSSQLALLLVDESLTPAAVLEALPPAPFR